MIRMVHEYVNIRCLPRCQMNTKHLSSKITREFVDKNATLARKLTTPKDGWIRTIRDALGMSGEQLAARLNTTRSNISRIEKAERDETINIKSLKNVASALNSQLVYAIVPNQEINKIIEKRAEELATKIVMQTSDYMVLEQQGLDIDKLKEEIEKVKKMLIEDNNNQIWNDRL